MVTIKVKDLLEKAKELYDDGIEYVDIDESGADDELPDSLYFEAYDGFGGGIDYESLDHVEVSADYKSE